MRPAFIRFSLAIAAVAVTMSCDYNTVSPKFGNGISGGPSGTQPVSPPKPGSPDTVPPFAVIDTPATDGLLYSVGDSIFTSVRIFDDLQLSGLIIVGLKITGDSSLGTLTKTVRYTTVPAPPPGQTFPPGSTALRIRRYLQPLVPVDTSVGPLTILAIVTDIGNNVDTVRRVVRIVNGPRVTILAPVPNDSVAQGVAMRVQIQITHLTGIRTDTIRIKGDTLFRASGVRLDTTFVKTFSGTRLNESIDTTILIPANAPIGGRITISTIAYDVNRNPGSTSPVTVRVRAVGTTTPRVTQIVGPRLELTDSVTVLANGDGITTVGVTVRDSVGTLLKTVSQALPPPPTSNARGVVPLLLPDTLQGRRVQISSFATDQNGRTGYSVASGQLVGQPDATLAFNDTALVVYGHTFPLPRAGIVGDISADDSRGNVFLSNTSYNRLEVWQGPSQSFFTPGIAVGSMPWGLARTAFATDSLLVGNSGGTNVSKVFIGTLNAAAMYEDVPNRVRTRISPIWEVIEAFNNGRYTISVKDPLLFSNRPQYIGQIADGTVYFSSRPTTEAPKGMIHWYKPPTPLGPQPDLHSIVQAKAAPQAANWLVMDVDSVYVRPAVPGSVSSDTLVIWDHLPNTLNPPGFVRCGSGVGACAKKARDSLGSDIVAIPNVDMSRIGYTDTTFVAVSGDKTWIAFGYGDTPGAGNIFMATTNFFSSVFSQTDLTNNAAEHLFGLALDSTGITVAGHGAASHFASVDQPFHLRLQGKYDTFQHGAGIAFHPAARGITTPITQRLAFVANDDASIQALDVAHFLFAGKLPIKTKLYGPLRVSRKFPTDAACSNAGCTGPDDIGLKLYGVASTGLIVIDVRNRDLKPVP